MIAAIEVLGRPGCQLNLLAGIELLQESIAQD